MHTILMLAWMAVCAAVIRRDGPVPEALCLCVLLACLFAGALEAGTAETGEESRWRKPARVAALLLFVASVLASSPSLFP